MSIKTITPSKWIHQNISLLGLDNPQKCAYMSIREMIENSLDSCETANILPKVRIDVKSENSNGYYNVKVGDNGPGIPEVDIPTAFGVVLSSSHYGIIKQQRGFLGLGGKGILQYAYNTTQKPFDIISSNGGDKYWIIRMGVDINRNKPIVFEKSYKPNSNWHGTIIRFQIKADFEKAKSDIKRYLTFTHVACPYVSLDFVMNDKTELELTRLLNSLPSQAKVMKYHPHGIDTYTLSEMFKESKQDSLVSFLTNNFQRVGHKTAVDFLKFAKLSDKNPKSLSKDEVKLLSDRLVDYENFQAPDTNGLSPITEDIKKAVMDKYHSEWVHYVVRKGVYEGHAFMVELCCSFGGMTGQPSKEFDFEIHRFANKIPLLYEQRSCILTRVILDTDFKGYNISPYSPLMFFVHLCSTKLPLKTAGKEYIADKPQIRKTLDLAVKELLRQLRIYLSHREKLMAQKHRQNIFNVYYPLIAHTLAQFSTKNTPESIEKVIKRVTST